MKIAYLSNSIIPSRTANSIHVMKMSQAFTKNGHELTLFAPERKDEEEPAVSDVFSYYGIKTPFRIKKIPQPRFMLRGHRALYATWTSVHSKVFKLDLAYGRNLFGCSFSALLGIPTIYELHAPIYDVKSDQFLFQRMINSSNLKKIIVITHALKNNMESRYPSLKGRIHVVPDAADEIPKDTQPLELAPIDKMQVVYIGHLYKGKGFELIEKLAPLCPWAHFHVVGGTKEVLDGIRQGGKLSSNLTLHGFVPPSQTPRYLLAADVLIAPFQKKIESYLGNNNNIGDWTSPLKIFEYMSAKKPIVCSDIPVLHEVLEEGQNTLFSDPEDPQTWVAALEKIRNDPVLAKRLADQAYLDFMNHYSWTQRAQKVLVV